MALQWKRNPRYPSTQKSGVFAEKTEFVGGIDILSDTWNKLNGIDDAEINKFKFALGSWTEYSRRNRLVRILSPGGANNIGFAITDDSGDVTEPKPTDVPPGYLEEYDGSPVEWAKANEIMSWTNEDSWWANSDSRVWRDGVQKDIDLADGVYANLESYISNNVSYAMREDVITLTPDWWDKIKAGDQSPNHYWQVMEKKKWRPSWNARERHAAYFLPNIHYSDFREELMWGFKSPGQQWEWRPSVREITDGTTGLTARGEWVEGGSLVITQNQPSSNNRYLGLVTKTPKQNIDDIVESDLFLYHEIGSDNYKDNSAPLEVFFSMNYFEKDLGIDRSADVIKYYILEWGDEDDDVKLSNENILNSEFFYIYETDDTTFDYVKYKKLCLIIADSEEMNSSLINSDGAARWHPDGKIHSHIYTDPGVKRIRTIIFRFDGGTNDLIETSVISTNIFIGDPNQTIQDFNIFGAEDYTVLPLEKELEPIIGNVDKESEYVRSIEKIRDNDLYQTTDYLEKLYAKDFLPKVNQDLYGEYAGNIDLSITRVFKKPYNIFDFIGGDALEIINNNFDYPQDSLPLNSSATEILIDNGDCVVNFNPSDQTNDQIENTGTSDEKGLIMGDYRLVKNPKQKIRKEDAMQLPKLNIQKKRQAF